MKPADSKAFAAEDHLSLRKPK